MQAIDIAAAKGIHIPRRTMIKHIHDGDLPAVKLPGHTQPWMIQRRDFTRYLRRHHNAERNSA